MNNPVHCWISVRNRSKAHKAFQFEKKRILREIIGSHIGNNMEKLKSWELSFIVNLRNIFIFLWNYPFGSIILKWNTMRDHCHSKILNLSIHICNNINSRNEINFCSLTVKQVIIIRKYTDAPQLQFKC